MRKRSWVWVGVGEATSTILAAALAYLINILTGEQHPRAAIVSGVIALVVFSALFAWGRRALEARRSAKEQPGGGSASRAPARSVTISGEFKSSPVVLSEGGPVVILDRVKSDSISVIVGGDSGRPADSAAKQAILNRPGQRPADGSGLAAVADELAISVDTQWNDEANWRHLSDPYAMPVRWVPADPLLTVSWPTLVRLATEGPGWPPASRSRESWAKGPAELAGKGNDLIDVLARVPTGRLAVLGEPGAGKTILLVRLILDLLAQRQPGQAVPILLPMGSWNPEQEELYAWMERWLTTDNPALSTPWPGTRRRSRARALLEEGFILPLLDGLDEMPAALTGKAIAEINDALHAGQRVILAARTDAFRMAVQRSRGAEVKLAGAAGIELCPLDTGVVIEYLRDSAGGQESAARWDDVAAVLAADQSAPVTQALTTPLMAALARAIYNPRPTESLSSVERHPAELLNQEMFWCREAVERHFFDVFIPAGYRQRRDESRNARCTADQAVRWLTFLAEDLQRRQGTTDFAWWQLQGAAPRLLPGLFAGLAAGITAALTVPWRGWGVGILTSITIAFIVRRQIHSGEPGLARGLAGGMLGCEAAAVMALIIFGAGPRNTYLGSFLAGSTVMGIVVAPAGRFYAGLIGAFAGETATAFYERASAFESIRMPVGSVAAFLVNGVALGLAVGLAAGLYNQRTPARGLRWSWLGFAVGIAVGGLLGFVIWATSGLTAGLICGGVAMVAGAVAGGMYEIARPTDTKRATSASAVLARDRATFFATFPLAFAVGLAAGLGTALSPPDPNSNGPYHGVAYGVGIGVVGFAAIALAFSFYQAMWGSFTLARWWLAAANRLPFRLMTFLTDAHTNRGVLRQVGAIYQFRHAELQRHLAGEPAAHSSASVSITDLNS